MDFFDPTNVARLIGLVVPLLVALVSKKVADGGVKGWLNVALSALAAVIATLIGADGGWAWMAFLNAWINAFIVGIAAYYGVYKPNGLTQSVTRNTANFGVVSLLGYRGSKRPEVEVKAPAA